MKRAQSADGVMHEFPDDTPDAVVDRAMKDYVGAGIDPVSTVQSEAQYYAKDIGRGLVRGIGTGMETLQPFNPAEMPGGESPGPASHPSQLTGRLAPPETPPGQIAERFGEGVPTMPFQPGGPVTKAVTTLGGAAGSYLGGRAVEDTEIPKPVGEAVGGFLGGASSGSVAASRTAARARALLPTSTQNRDTAKRAADAINQQGITIAPTEVRRFAGQLRTDLLGHPFTPLSSSRTFQFVKNLEKGKGDLATIIDAHSRLGQIPPREGSDWAAAMFARDKIREWVANLQPGQIVGGKDPQLVGPLWQLHRDTWRIHSNLEEIYGALESAEWRKAASGAGTNLNVMRQNIRRILDNDNLARRYAPEAKEAMAELVEGDFARNTMRKLAKFAPHGPVSGLTATAAFATGHADFGAAIAAGGFIAHMLQGKLEQRSLDALLDIIREGSPLTTQAAHTAVSRARAPITSMAAGRGSLLGPGTDSPLTEEAPPPHPGL